MSNLRPAVLDDLGIVAAMSWLCRESQKTYPAVSIEPQIEIEENVIPDDLRTPIFRILQEALNNVAKHSRATLVSISFSKSDGNGIELEIRDNGQGFEMESEAPAEAPRGGLGLVSMRERAELSGGFFALKSAEGKGTTIRALWPVTDHL
jgi:signal transduction histidine kinase